MIINSRILPRKRDIIPDGYAGFIPQNESETLKCFPPNNFYVRSENGMGYLSEFSGEQIDEAIRLVLNGAVLPKGGVGSQVLAKKSGMDYDVTWKTPEGEGGGASVLEMDAPNTMYYGANMRVSAEAVNSPEVEVISDAG